MNENFEAAFAHTVGIEGGFTQNPKDRGNWTTGKIGVGELKGTKYGISAMAYPHLDIANLGIIDARAIYMRDYWTPSHCDILPSGIDALVFDMAVNHGNFRALKILQEALGVTTDGIIGPVTLAAIQKADHAKLLEEITARRGVYYGNIPSFDTFGLGWMRRLVRMLILSIAMTTAKPESAPLDSPKESDKEAAADEPQSPLWGLFRRV